MRLAGHVFLNTVRMSMLGNIKACCVTRTRCDEVIDGSASTEHTAYCKDASVKLEAIARMKPGFCAGSNPA